MEGRKTGFILASQILGELFQFAQRLPGVAVTALQTMFDVIVDQSALGIADGAFDRVKLLGQIKTGPIIGEHRKDASEVAMGALEALDDVGM
jgi:hypothetical protein